MHLRYLDPDIAYARKDFSLHVVTDGDVDGVAFVHFIYIDREVVLIVTDALSLVLTLFVDELAKYGISLLDAFPTLVGRKDSLVYDEGQAREWEGSCGS